MRWIALTVLVLLFSAACGREGNTASCQATATKQAEAELAWSSSLEAHAAAHETGQEHSAVEEQTFVSRVALIVATEATRRACQ